jgi:hypothetical protein
MSAKDRVDVTSVGQGVEADRSPPKPIGQQAPSETPVIGAPRIYGLVAYYMVLLAGSVALLVFVILKQKTIDPPLLEWVAFVASGAIAGSVLYHIRMLFTHYIKRPNFDARWLSKYISGPWEAVVLALAVLSLMQGGGAILGGASFSVTEGNSFAAFGLGALIGFGIREVVGWIGNLARTMFPTEPKS